MNFPTKEHEEYVEYMRNICERNHLSLILKGSLAHGTAKIFSDIDFVICGNVSADLLDQIISGYDKIVMTNQTENPKGIYILNYENGISVDLDIRQTILSSDISKNMVLCDCGFKITDIIERSSISSEYIPERPEWYKTIRLVHRCCVKYLCGKMDIAQGLTEEVSAAVFALTNKEINVCDSIKQQMKSAFETIEKNYPVDQSIVRLLEDLFQAMDARED